MVYEMSNKSEQIIGDFLNHHRYEPPERDGWYSGYEIQRGIVQELGKRVPAYRLYPTLDRMLEAQPPVVEDTWMLTSGDGNPDISQQYSHPGQPDGARRFYRVIDASVEYIPPQ